jgi:hypothetical protein
MTTETTEQIVEPTEAVTPEAAAPTEAAKPAEATPEAPKYDYVPAKFMKPDGSPDFEKMAKSYTGLEKKLGSKPNIPASSIDDYEWDAGELQLDPDRVSEFKAQVLEKGFTKEQYAFVMESHKAVIESMVWNADKAEAALKVEWGKDYETHATAAKAGFDEFAPSDANPNDPVWNHPAVMKLLARIGSEVGEDSVANKSGSGSKSAAMSEDEVVAMMKTPEYRNGNRDLHAKVTAWYQKNTR